MRPDFRPAARLAALACLLGLGVHHCDCHGLYAAPQETAPAAFVFTHPEAKKTWREGLPADCVAVSPTCVYSPSQRAVFLLAERCGLGAGYEVEFLLLGNLSDRAYEGLAVAWDPPSVVGKAVAGLGVPKGVPANVQRGLGLAQGERFTVELRRLGKDEAFRPLADFVDDQCSTPAQNLFARGFPFVGTDGYDDDMPAAILSAYAEPKSLFGLPYPAPKSAVYGLFRSKTEEECGAPAVIALRWQRLPDGQPRVLKHRVTVDAAAIADPDALLDTLKKVCEDPRDVFLDVRLDPALKLSEVVPFAKLIVALEAEGGFTIDAPAAGQLPIRAFLPNDAWRDRKARVFQPWEVEIAPPPKPGEQAVVTLCQILEDWTVDGPDPALTRKCYPDVTPKSIVQVLKRVDVNAGKVYVVFFYAEPGVTVGDLVPFAAALADVCPTQWVFLNAPAPKP